jgi:hypothetical protein
MEILWSLGHRKTKVVEKNLYTNQLVQKVVESLASGDQVEDWMVWCSGWIKWKNLIDVSELMLEVNILKRLSTPPEIPNSEPPNMPPEPPMPDSIEQFKAPPEPHVSLVKMPSAKVSEQEITKSRNDIEDEDTTNGNKKHPEEEKTSGSGSSYKEQTETNWGEKRQFKRIDARFRCIIKSSSLTFRTFTRDVSLGGVALEDAIPNELLGNECTIYITSSNNKKNLKFKIKVTQRPGAKFFSFENTDAAFMNELNIWLEQFISVDASKKKIS